jgi:hypothetical protein
MAGMKLKQSSIVALELKEDQSFVLGALKFREVLGGAFQAAWSPVISLAEHCAMKRIPQEEVDRLLDEMFTHPSYGSVYQGEDPLTSATVANVDFATAEAMAPAGTRPECLQARFEVKQVDGGDMQFAFCLWTEMTFGWTVHKDKHYDYGTGPSSWTFWVEAWPGREVGPKSQMLARAKAKGFQMVCVGLAGADVPRRFPDVSELERKLRKKYIEEQLNMEKAIAERKKSEQEASAAGSGTPSA